VTALESLPTDLAAAHAMILAERAARLQAIADLSSTEALISHLKLEIEKLRRGALRHALGAQGAIAGTDGASA